jgi:hypothetical protein
MCEIRISYRLAVPACTEIRWARIRKFASGIIHPWYILTQLPVAVSLVLAYHYHLLHQARMCDICHRTNGITMLLFNSVPVNIDGCAG